MFLSRVRLLVFLALATTLFATQRVEIQEEATPSTPEQAATHHFASNSLAGNVVSPITGLPSLTRTDLLAKGAQNIHLNRVYIPISIPESFPTNENQKGDWDKYLLHQYVSKHYRGWRFFLQSLLHFDQKEQRILYTSPSGTTLAFILNGPTFTHAHLEKPLAGLCNAQGLQPGGQYDPRNIRICYNSDKSAFIVKDLDRTTRVYRYAQSTEDTRQFYLLEKEILSNGKVLRYSYNSGYPSRIDSLDPTEEHTYASIKIEGRPRFSKMSAHTSCGKKASYHFERPSVFAALSQKEKHWLGSSKKETEYELLFPPILTHANTPHFSDESSRHNNSLLFTSYENHLQKFDIEYALFGDDQKYWRARAIHLPDEQSPSYSLDYNSPIPGRKRGSTTIQLSDGTTIEYKFNKKLLTTSIKHFSPNHICKKETLLGWDHDNHLKTIHILDENKSLLSETTFEYDKYGNPILETLKAPLTNSKQFETKTTSRKFSTDRKNLLLEETTEEGFTTTYTYLPGTDLLTKKQTPFLTQTWTYDKAHNLIEKTHSEETKKTVTRYHLRQTAPFLHMPDTIEEFYVENDTETLLKRTTLHYDDYGNVDREDILDATGSHAYTLEKAYDKRGNLLSETNPLGQKAHYTYDPKGRLVKSHNFSGRIETTWKYDKRGRPIRKTLSTSDGITRNISYKYDNYDRLIEKTDHFGNTTTFAYDLITNQVVQTNLSPTETHKTISTRASYDALGRKVSSTDANGHTTTYQYNIYGSPTDITHPDGSLETFRYNKNGYLITHIDPDGNTIQYKRDLLGRTLQKTYLSPQGEKLFHEKYTYKGAYLSSHQNKEGYTTHFQYDGAGRKIKEQYENKTTTYSYDPLGYLATTCQNNTLVTQYKNDILGRVLEEKKLSLKLNPLHLLHFTYDDDGNQSTITRYIHNKPCTEQTTYDALGRKTAITDPLGNTTHIQYNENATDSLGQRVLQIVTIDPENITTTVTHDTHGQVTQYRKCDICRNTTYDPNGNLSTHTENGQTTHYTYTPMNKVATKRQSDRITTYTYTPSGKLLTKTYPDGISLTYRYYPHGPLKTLLSTDKTIHHTFTYNKLHQLLSATDHINDLSIHRTVDPHGNTLQEKLPNSTISKTYDLFDRPLSLTTPHGTIHYEYDPLYLRKVTRSTYTHTYTTYDLAGNLIQEELPFNLGTVQYTLDSCQRITNIKSPYFTQNCTYSPTGNLLSSNDTTYTYNNTHQLIQENSSTYAYDSLYNRTAKNSHPYTYNKHNELLSDHQNTYTYDKRGNRITKNTTHYTYDALNQLTQTYNTQHQYDPLGRRLSKNTTHFLYNGTEEIGTADTLKVTGLATLAIEYNQQIYIPLLDTQKSIRRLIDPTTKKTVATFDYTAFGENLTPNNHSYQFQSKRFDPETNLIYYGKRFYDPTIGRWLTHDPAGTLDSYNPYQYNYNNPFLYHDPTGEAAFLVIPLLIWGAGASIPSLTTIFTTTAIGIAAGYGAYKTYQYIEQLNQPSYNPEGVTFVGGTLTSTTQQQNEKYLNYTQRRKKEGGIDETSEQNPKKPPYSGKELGNDPTKCPGKGFQWRGKGKPGSSQGSWYNENTGESLHPDLKHPPPIKPHWDYKGPEFPNGSRLNTDGSWEPK